MTPEEKWKRLTNPKSAENYGIVLTEEELETFSQGREVLAGLKQYTTSQNDVIRIAEKLGIFAAETLEKVMYGTFTVAAMPASTNERSVTASHEKI